VGIASVSAIIFLIFGIIAFTGGGGKGAGITGIVFAMLSNVAAGAFVATKPPGFAELTTSTGMYLSSLGGMAGIAFGIVMIIAARKAAVPAAPQGYPQQPMPQGYPQQGAPQGYPQQGMPPQAYPPQGTPPQGQGGPGTGMPPQG